MTRMYIWRSQFALGHGTSEKVPHSVYLGDQFAHVSCQFGRKTISWFQKTPQIVEKGRDLIRTHAIKSVIFDYMLTQILLVKL